MCIHTPRINEYPGGVETKTVDSRPHLITITPPLFFIIILFFFTTGPRRLNYFQVFVKPSLEESWREYLKVGGGKEDKMRKKGREKTRKKNNFDET